MLNQIEVDKSQIDSDSFLKEGAVVTIIINSENSNILAVDMPQNVVLEVVESEPGVKGNTATNATKTAESGTATATAPARATATTELHEPGKFSNARQEKGTPQIVVPE